MIRQLQYAVSRQPGIGVRVKPKPEQCCFPSRSFKSAARPRQRRDGTWIPTVNLRANDESSDATQLLIRAGYLRQAYSGIFHLLPLGLRVQGKLESLIDKHMQSIGASKVALSTLSSQKLWARSGRLNAGSELFKLQDRKGSKWLLAPTHEEEITTLVKELTNSPGQLPVRLYQITRKYRDEKRPRGGLLRGREFIMKDLYTFDMTSEMAHATYDGVRKAYRNLFDELAVPYIEARADSGNMGGSLSHEYHFPSSAGEDDVISCKTCGYARNEEWVPDCPQIISDIDIRNSSSPAPNVSNFRFTTSEFTNQTKTALIKAFVPEKYVESQLVQLNQFAIKAAVRNLLHLDTGIENPQEAFLAANDDDSLGGRAVYYVFDPSIDRKTAEAVVLQDREWFSQHHLSPKMVTSAVGLNSAFSLLKQSTGDSCPQCHDGKLHVQKAIEVGHTFHLGTRYTSKLGFAIKENQNDPTPIEMGCHGIGVSRLVAAIASAMSDKIGLNWPASIAPYQVVIVVDGADQDRLVVAEKLYDSISHSAEGPFDVLLDDRSNVSNGFKLKDADMIGYPIIIVIGRAFVNGQVEVQCRVRNLKTTINIDSASSEVSQLLCSLLN